MSIPTGFTAWQLTAALKALGLDREAKHIASILLEPGQATIVTYDQAENGSHFVRDGKIASTTTVIPMVSATTRAEIDADGNTHTFDWANAKMSIIVEGENGPELDAPKAGRGIVELSPSLSDTDRQRVTEALEAEGWEIQEATPKRRPARRLRHLLPILAGLAVAAVGIVLVLNVRAAL